MSAPPRAWVVASAVIGLALCAPMAGAGQQIACKPKLTADSPVLGPGSTAADACGLLARILRNAINGTSLIDSLNASLPLPPPRQLQSTMSETSGAAGSAAQGSAIPSIRPVGLASGSLAAVGTEAGAGGIASLSVNPLVAFLLAEGAESGTAALAKYARFMDVSAFFPVRNVDANDDGKIDYFGLRVRLNFTGLKAGDEIWGPANAALVQIADADARTGLLIEDLLVEVAGSRADSAAAADAVTMCADAVRGGNPAAIEVGCGRRLELEQPDEAAYGRLARSLSAVRDKADSRYLGVDLRLDFGDPSLGEVPGSSGWFGFLGVAHGGRFGEGGDQGPALVGYRLRGGLRVASLDQPDTTHVALEAGAGLELSRTRNGRQMALSFGLEARYGSGTDRAAQFRTNYLIWRAAFNMPLTAANSVTVSMSRAIDGSTNITPTFSVGADLGLLFPGLGGGG